MDPPALTAATCGTAEADGSCPQGAQLRLKGENLRGADAVVFAGHRGRRDNRTTTPVKTSPHRVVVRVPSSARSGRVRVVQADQVAKGPRVAIASSAASSDGVFPLRSKHSYGTATNGFGGGRGHQGQDLLAGCGKPVVAALAGVVTMVKWQDRAGNYVVVKAEDGTSQAYMHLLKPATLSRGDRVEPGEQIGQVGQTGRATACMLHFELWTAPGWYEGGAATDPTPTLKRWDATS